MTREQRTALAKSAAAYSVEPEVLDDHPPSTRLPSGVSEYTLLPSGVTLRVTRSLKNDTNSI